MSNAAPVPANELPADDRGAVEVLVAACIEALERGDRAGTTRICAERPELLPRVQRRLAQLAARGLIPPADDTVPDTIGPYRIVRELGSGGMGAVYLAEQAEPVQRLVALKVIKLGMDTREVVARFEAERQALATMSHPNIAQVFDAGITPAGRPYFVMEHVEGRSLTHFCDRRALLPEARVQLLATVCRAVQHAHDRGFVHRDLKPGNVLIAEHDGVFVPKIIDFGIVKAITPTAAGAGANEPRTRAGEMLGTPEYMSPEQAASGGLHVDARTDVYSLGAVLYELLCGEMPFDSARLRRGSRSEMERILQDELPALPSERLARVDGAAIAARGKERTSLRRLVAGELDWITLKALAKDPAHRYASALAFAEDLERWLRHEPVHAAPPARTYRLRKFVRRHRTVVLASAAAVLATAGSAFVVARVAASDIAKVEERAAADAQAVADRLLQRANEPRIRNAAQNDEVRQALVAEALALYERCQVERPRDAGLRQRRCDALITLSQVQWQLGQLADAERSGAAALAEARALHTELPQDLARRSHLAGSARRAGRAMFTAGRTGDAKPLFEEAVLHLEACAAAAPEAHGLSYSSALRELGTTLEKPDEQAASTAAFRKSVDVLAQLEAAGSKNPVVARDLCIARSALGGHLAGCGQVDEAEAVLARAASDLETVRAERSRVATPVHRMRAELAMRRNDAAGAVKHLTAAVAAAEQWAAAEPGRLQPVEALSLFLDHLAEQHGRLAQFDDANLVLQRSIALAERMCRDFPGDARRPRVLAQTLYQAAHALWDRYRHRDLDQAHAWALRARDEHAVAVASAAAPREQHVTYTSLLLRIADSRGDDTAAGWEELAKSMPVDAPPATPDLDQHFDAWIAIAASRLRHGQLAEVPLALAQAEPIIQVLPKKPKAASDVAWMRARLAVRSGDAPAAAAAAERILKTRSTWFGRWRAAECLARAAGIAGVDAAQASAWRDKAAGLFRSVADELAADVARDPLDPWQTLPWGFCSVQLAELHAAADRNAARQLLDAALPVLEQVREQAHRDVWQQDVWEQALALRRSLDETR